MSSDRFAVLNLKLNIFVCYKKVFANIKQTFFFMTFAHNNKYLCVSKDISVSVLPRPGAPLSSRRSFLQGGEGQAEGLVRERNLFAPLFLFFWFTNSSRSDYKQNCYCWMNKRGWLLSHTPYYTMKDLWVLAVSGIRERPNLAHNLVTHRH